MSLLDAFFCIAEVLDLVELIRGAGTSDQESVPSARRAWWPPERTVVRRVRDRTTDRT